MPTYRRLACGHFYRTDLPEPDECPHCAEYAEAFAQDVVDALLDDYDRPVVPHTRP
jgi:hypothetical protein